MTGRTVPGGWDWEDRTGRTGPGGREQEDRTLWTEQGLPTGDSTGGNRDDNFL